MAVNNTHVFQKTCLFERVTVESDQGERMARKRSRKGLVVGLIFQSSGSLLKCPGRETRLKSGARNFMLIFHMDGRIPSTCAEVNF